MSEGGKIVENGYNCCEKTTLLDVLEFLKDPVYVGSVPVDFFAGGAASEAGHLLINEGRHNILDLFFIDILKGRIAFGTP